MSSHTKVTFANDYHYNKEWKVMQLQKSGLFCSPACRYCGTNICTNFSDMDNTKSKLDDFAAEDI